LRLKRAPQARCGLENHGCSVNHARRSLPHRHRAAHDDPAARGHLEPSLRSALEHLAEVDARGLHRTLSCSSLYTYCIYELRFSEDAAVRRSAAAKLVQRFPAILHAVARGEIHLTGLLMLGPHLTDENHVEVLARARFRTKREIATLVRRLAPLPAVPDRVAPLGPAPSGAVGDATWLEFVESLCPPIRELPVGSRPSDWVSEPANAKQANAKEANAEEVESPADAATKVAGHAWWDAPPLYQVQFTTTAEHAELLERVRALLSHRSPKLSLGELYLQAVRLLVESLEKERYGAKRVVETKPAPVTTARVRAEKSARDNLDAASDSEASSAQNLDASSGAGMKTAQNPDVSSRAGTNSARNSAAVDAPETHARLESERAPRRRGRYIPAGVRRAVFERDEHRCAYLDERGVRCPETRLLEIHHRAPFARGGPHQLENLTLHCHAHNALVAERDFGRESIEQRRGGGRHEPRRCF
jgi:hypothetical protein